MGGGSRVHDCQARAYHAGHASLLGRLSDSPSRANQPGARPTCICCASARISASRAATSACCAPAAAQQAAEGAGGGLARGLGCKQHCTERPVASFANTLIPPSEEVSTLDMQCSLEIMKASCAAHRPPCRGSPLVAGGPRRPRSRAGAGARTRSLGRQGRPAQGKTVLKRG